MKSISMAYLAALVLLASGFESRGAQTYVVFSNLPVNDSYSLTGHSTIISGSSGGPYYRGFLAMAFTPDRTVKFERLELPLATQDHPNAVAYLMSDNEGKPGTILDTITLGGVVPSVKTYVHRLLVATSVSKPQMTAGTRYWAVIAPANDSLMHALCWYPNVTGYSGLGARVNTANGDWQTWTTGTYSLAMRVVGAYSTCARPVADLDNNCKVDFRDYAIFMNSWLVCGYENPNDC